MVWTNPVFCLCSQTTFELSGSILSDTALGSLWCERQAGYIMALMFWSALCMLHTPVYQLNSHIKVSRTNTIRRLNPQGSSMKIIRWITHSDYEAFIRVPLDKMAVIWNMTFSNAFSWLKVLYFEPISPKFVPRDQIGNNAVLVQVRAWHRTGDKPLPEPMVAQLTDTYMRH